MSRPPRRRSFLRDNGLSLVVGALFAATLCGQVFAGLGVYNESQAAAGAATTTLLGYLGTGHFVEAFFENWESEFLQMGLYVALTAVLFQRGSAESKDPDDEEDKEARHPLSAAPWPVRYGGWVAALYRNSLTLVLLVLFAASLVAHALGGRVEYNREQRHDHKPEVSLKQFVGTSEFWFQSMQNWQSEFFSIGAIVVLSIWLRQKGSPESKAVNAPHESTGA